MAGVTQARREIEASWRSFVIDGQLPDGVRPEIRRSWQRVRGEWHVDPGILTCPRAIAAEGVRERAEAEEAFRVALPIVSEFARRLARDGHVVGYFDADGVMLALDGNNRTRARLADVNFAPGACWAESAAGTNGPGTALAEARPVEVFAAEHFVEAWHAWTCASVPVRSRGRVIGAVDITSPWTAHNPVLLLTAEALARAIEAQIEAVAAQRENAILLRVAHDAVRARNEFLAVAAHELKTPLTPLLLNIQKLQRLVARPGAPLDPDRLLEVLRGADQNVHGVVELIDDLLDVSRAVHQPLHLAVEPTDLGAIARSVVQRHRPTLERQGCTVQVTARCDAVGRWDPTRIEQAFKHVLVNAMKYAPGRIEVEVDADHVSARLLVRDHGPGIAAENQERIFCPFERAASYRNIAGFGLGLHIVRQIVEAHGGAVRLESTLGEGSTFVIELPLRSATPKMDRSAAPAQSRTSTARSTR